MLGLKDAAEARLGHETGGNRDAHMRVGEENAARSGKSASQARVLGAASSAIRRRRVGGRHATRRSVTTGRCLRPPSNSTASSKQTPGLPLTRLCRLALGGLDAAAPAIGEEESWTTVVLGQISLREDIVNKKFGGYHK